MAKTAANVSNKSKPAPTTAVATQKPAPVAPVANGLPPKPQWLVDKGLSRKGAENLAQFIIPPRLKIVQKMAKREEFGAFNTGDLLVMPEKRMLSPVQFSDDKPWDYSCALLFVPIFFYPEWVGVNPFAANLSMIRERSTDPNSEVAAKALVRYKEPCAEMPKDSQGNPLFVQYGENLNCVLIPQNVNLQNHKLHPEAEAELLAYVEQLQQTDTLLLASWRSGGHKYGRSFAGLMQKRQTDIFACMFEMQTCFDKGTGKGDFFALSVDNPENATDVYVHSQEAVNRYEQLYDMLAEANSKQLLRAEYDEDTTQTNVDASRAPY